MIPEERPVQHRHERGQILVLFTISLVVLISMVGLVIDAGSAYAQRRAEQTVADLASLAGARAYLNTDGDAAAKTLAAEAAARAVALTNGYTSGVNNTTVDVNVVPSTASTPFATVQVGISRPHRNAFIGLIGMSSWDVSVDATAGSTGSPNAAKGVLPLLFNEKAFPAAQCDEGGGEDCSMKVVTYQEPPPGDEDVPQDETQFNWTIFCAANGNPCNGNSDGVRDIINGYGTEATVTIDQPIGPLNAGSHTTLFDALEKHIGRAFPVPIVCSVSVDPDCLEDGAMVGFAYFKLTGVEGSSQKVIKGYFVSPVEGKDLTYVPTAGQSTLNAQTYVVSLID